MTQPLEARVNIGSGHQVIRISKRNRDAKMTVERNVVTVGAR